MWIILLRHLATVGLSTSILRDGPCEEVLWNRFDGLGARRDPYSQKSANA